MPERNVYTIISGTGRSGSNRLLDMFDASPYTVCRNEVNSIPGSSFFAVGGKLFFDDFSATQRKMLRAAVDGATIRRSARDRLNQTDKDYLTRAGRISLGAMEKARLRNMLAKLGVIGDAREWIVPQVLLNDEGLSRARLVLKLNSCPAWAQSMVSEDNSCRIIHNIRDPRGFLNSWYNRLIKNGVGTTSFEENFGDVAPILEYFGRTDAERLRSPTEENLVEVDLWRWRHVNENLLSLESHAGQYIRISYKEIEADRVEVARKAFAFAELPFEAEEEARIGSLRNVLFQKPHTTRLDAEMCNRLVGKVLEDSPLKDLVET